MPNGRHSAVVRKALYSMLRDCDSSPGLAPCWGECHSPHSASLFFLSKTRYLGFLLIPPSWFSGCPLLPCPYREGYTTTPWDKFTEVEQIRHIRFWDHGLAYLSWRQIHCILLGALPYAPRFCQHLGHLGRKTFPPSFLSPIPLSTPPTPAWDWLIRTNYSRWQLDFFFSFDFIIHQGLKSFKAISHLIFRLKTKFHCNQKAEIWWFISFTLFKV